MEEQAARIRMLPYPRASISWAIWNSSIPTPLYSSGKPPSSRKTERRIAPHSDWIEEKLRSVSPSLHS